MVTIHLIAWLETDMGVNAKARARIVDAFAQFMRGEIDADQFYQARKLIRSQHRNVRSQDYTAYGRCRREFKPNWYCMREIEFFWNMQLRDLAFLLAGHEEPQWNTIRPLFDYKLRGTLICLAILAAWMIGAGWLSNWYDEALIVGWLLAGAISIGLAVIYRRLRPPAVRPRNDFEPFANESDWVAAQPLLSHLCLPTFDVAKSLPTPGPASEWKTAPILVPGALLVISILVATPFVAVSISPIIGIYLVYGPGRYGPQFNPQLQVEPT